MKEILDKMERMELELARLTQLLYKIRKELEELK